MRGRSASLIVVMAGVALLLAGCAAGGRRTVTAAPEPAPTAEATSELREHRAQQAGSQEAPPPLAAETPLATPEPTAAPTTAVTAPPPPAVPVRPASPAPPSTVPVTPSFRAAEPARVISRGRTDRNFIALSFDAGADVGYTTQILDTLRERGVRASFGITGRWAEQNPDAMRRIVAEGHHLINHTYNHDSFTGLSTKRGPMPAAARADELAKTEAAVRAITGVEFGPYFRPRSATTTPRSTRT